MAAVCGTSGIASLFSQAAFAADSDIADGQTQRFDFSILQSMAHDLAQTAWRGAPRPLPDTLATMTVEWRSQNAGFARRQYQNLPRMPPEKKEKQCRWYRTRRP